MTTDNNQPPFSETALDFTAATAKVSLADSDSWAFGYEDFTIESWVYCTDLLDDNEGGDYLDDKAIFGSMANLNKQQFLFYIRHTGHLGFWDGNDAVGRSTYDDNRGRLENETWHHVALVRRNLRIYMYVDGQLVYTGCNAVEYKQTNGFSVGAVYDPYLSTGPGWSRHFNGQMQDFRVTKGHAVYTSDFVLAKSLLNKCSAEERCPSTPTPTPLSQPTPTPTLRDYQQFGQIQLTYDSVSEIKLPILANAVGIGSYGIMIDWGNGDIQTGRVFTASGDGYITKTYDPGHDRVTVTISGELLVYGATSGGASSNVDLTSVTIEGMGCLRNLEYAFLYSPSLTSIDLSNFDSSNVTNMHATFDQVAASTLDLSNLDTSSVTTMAGMFRQCQATSLDLSNFDTSSVTDMSQMFYQARQLTSLNVSSFDTSHVTDMNSMFQTCDKLPSLDLTNFDTSSVQNMMGMFYLSDVLETITGHETFDTSSVTDMSHMFTQTFALTNDNVNFDSWCVSGISSAPDDFRTLAGFTEEPNWGASC